MPRVLPKVMLCKQDAQLLNIAHRKIMATMQFYPGVDEPVVPTIKLTRSKDGAKGTASFVFENPKALTGENVDGISGLYMVDEEGEMSTKDVNARFVNGQPFALEVLYIIRSPEGWDRFIRFMDRYSEKNGLGLTKKEAS